MQNFKSDPVEMIRSLLRNRGLVRNLISREIVGRYRGSMLGIVWSFVTPLFMLAVYTFVFSVVFQARWNAGSDSKIEFALVLFVGLLVFNVFAECANRAPGLILSNVNYVKKVVFPLEILPWVTIGNAAFHFCVSFVIWLLAYTLLIGVPHWTVILSPLVMLPFGIFVVGVSWILASLGVFLRDIGQLVGILVQVLMFMTPIFYPASILPPAFQTAMYLNPLTLPVEMMRDVLYWGRPPSVLAWLSGLAVALAVAQLGFAWFQKTRKGFADVL